MYAVVDEFIDLIHVSLYLFLIYLCYRCGTYTLNYWRERGMPYVTPLPIFGNLWQIFDVRTQIVQFIEKHYHKFDTACFGMFIIGKPYLVIKCPEVIKLTVGKDFHDTKERSFICKKSCTPVGLKWKYLRSKLLSDVTSGDLEKLVFQMDRASEEMLSYLKSELKRNQSIEVKELSAKFATDIIGCLVFGVDANSFRCTNEEFRKDGLLLAYKEWKKALTKMSYAVLLYLIKLFRVPFYNSYYVNRMQSAFWLAIKEKERLLKRRDDINDTLKQIKKITMKGGYFHFEGERLSKEATPYFSEGFENITPTIAFALYELRLQKRIQWKVHYEVVSAIVKHQEFTYETLQDMPYLDLVIYETLRKYPTHPFLDKVCEEDYHVPNSDLVIKKGTSICIPVLAFHYDTKYFMDPDSFKPERFCCENRKGLPVFAYIPFAWCTRCCIGRRLGFLAIKLALARILYKYEIKTNIETPDPLKCLPKGYFFGSKLKIPLTLEETC